VCRGPGRRGRRTLGAPSAYPSTAGRDAGFVLEARGITADEAASALAAAQALVGLSIREAAAQTLRQLAQRCRPPRDVAAASAVGTSPYSYRGRAYGGGPPCVSDPKRTGYAAGPARRVESRHSEAPRVVKLRLRTGEPLVEVCPLLVAHSHSAYTTNPELCFGSVLPESSR
jgi:hypothetical protein